MAESMRMTFLDASFGSQRIDDLPKSIPIEGSMKLAQKKRSVRVFAVLALGKVAPHKSAGRLSHIYNSPFASLCLAGVTWTDADLARLHIHISHTKRA